jgi:peptidoglycan/LPS O-acetylase OafA/YrhL
VAIALVALVVAKNAGRFRSRLLVLAAAGAVTSLTIPVFVSVYWPRVYFGTEFRAGEILAGVCLAAVLHPPAAAALVARHAATFATAGAVAAVLLAYWIATSTPFVLAFDHRALPYLTILSVVVLIGALVPGPLALLLRAPALVWLGRRSYGIFLLHQPTWLAFKQLAPDRSQFANFLVSCAATLFLADVSYRYVEMPVRERRVPLRTQVVAGSLLAGIVIACTFVR